MEKLKGIDEIDSSSTLLFTPCTPQIEVRFTGGGYHLEFPMWHCGHSMANQMMSVISLKIVEYHWHSVSVEAGFGIAGLASCSTILSSEMTMLLDFGCFVGKRLLTQVTGGGSLMLLLLEWSEFFYDLMAMLVIP
jgi:hypothetical protein